MSQNEKIQKIKYDEYLKKHRLNRFDRGVERVLSAYSDCIDEIVSGFDKIERNLNFFEVEPFEFKRALDVMAAAVPNGYNDFEVDLVFKKIADVFGTDCQIFVARESSVCLYVKPTGRVWLNRDEKLQTLADEVSFDSTIGAFRLWWD